MKERIDRHKDGSIKAKGHMKGGRARGTLGVVQKRRQQNAVGLFC
jgi:hypothetical protein